MGVVHGHLEEHIRRISAPKPHLTEEFQSNTGYILMQLLGSSRGDSDIKTQVAQAHYLRLLTTFHHPLANGIQYWRFYIPSNPDNIFVKKGFFARLIFGGAYFLRGLIWEGILHFKMGWA